MKNFVLAPLLALAIWASAGRAEAADNKNKCGCYKNASGVCFCDKKAKCGCPGDCEPKGCDAAREKQIQKEIDAETKKAAEAGRRHVPAEKSSSKSDKGDKGSGEETSKASRESHESLKPAAATEPAPPSGKKLNAAQVKQLVKLLDQYFAESPDARAKNAEDLRNELSQSR
jgi:hypothetical protein